MSVHFVCPACGASTRVSAPVPEECYHCRVRLPATLWASLSAEAEREAIPMPGPLQLGRLGSSIAGGMFLILLLLAPWDAGSYTINNESVSGPEFLRRAGVAWGAIALDLVATAYALWTEQWWSRWTMMAYWVLSAAAMWSLSATPLEGLGSAFSVLLFFGAPAGFYLFGKENVVRYYQMLERQADAAESPAAKGGR